MQEDKDLRERVAVLEANHTTLFRKLDEVVDQLKIISDYYVRSQGFARGVQWIAGGLLMFIGWAFEHFKSNH